MCFESFKLYDIKKWTSYKIRNLKVFKTNI